MLPGAMRSRSYPLEAVVELRDSKVKEAARRLAAAARAREAAERAREAVQIRRADHDGAADVVRRAELGALARGQLRAVDLARADAWALRVAAERDALTAGIASARAAEATAIDHEHHAGGDVASFRADAKVVEKHRAGWDDAERKASEAREEDALSEAWRSGR
jgi:nicotinamide riboside kinase